MEKEKCTVNVKKMVVLGKASQSILADSRWLSTSEEIEIVLMVEEGSIEELARSGICRSYISMQGFLKNLKEEYLNFDYFFVADDVEAICKQLISAGVPAEKVYVHANIYRFLCPKQKMRFLEEAIYLRDHKKYEGRFISVGRFTYGVPKIRFCTNEKESITIGSFCSIASGVAIYGGGEHRPDWMSTYPFNVFFKEDLGGV